METLTCGHFPSSVKPSLKTRRHDPRSITFASSTYSTIRNQRNFRILQNKEPFWKFAAAPIVSRKLKKSCTTRAFYGGSGHTPSSFIAKIISSGRFWTNALLAINCICFFATQQSNGYLFSLGAKVNHLIARGQWWRLLTAAVLHGSLPHLMVNSLSLNNIGPSLEYLSGGLRFLTLYIFSAISGNFLSYKMSRSPAVGASGAIFGLIGAQLVFLLRHQHIFGGSSSAIRSLLSTIGMNLIYGMSGARVDNWGHLGGLIGGVLAALVMGPVYRKSIISSTLVEISLWERLRLR